MDLSFAKKTAVVRSNELHNKVFFHRKLDRA